MANWQDGYSALSEKARLCQRFHIPGGERRVKYNELAYHAVPCDQTLTSIKANFLCLTLQPSYHEQLLEATSPNQAAGEGMVWRMAQGKNVLAANPS